MKPILLSLLIISQLISAPAFSKIREFKNHDGTVFIAKAQGNQHLNWIESTDGEILKYNIKTKNFDYAIIENKMLKASGVKYQNNNSKRTRSLGHIPKLEKEKVYQLLQERREKSMKKRFVK